MPSVVLPPPPDPWRTFYAARLRHVLRAAKCITQPSVAKWTDAAQPLRVLVHRDHQRHHTVFEALLRCRTARDPVDTVPFEGYAKLRVHRVEPAMSPDHRWCTVSVDVPPHATHADFADQSTCKHISDALYAMQVGQYKQPSPKPFVTNPRFANVPVQLRNDHGIVSVCFDQLDFTAGDWSDLWYHGAYTSYVRMRAPRVAGGGKPRARVQQVVDHVRARYFGKGSPYVALSPATTVNTLRYVFQRLQKGILVRIKDNAVDTFLPFIRQAFTNTYYEQLTMPQSPDDAAQLQQLRACETELRQLDDTIEQQPHATPPQVQQRYRHLLLTLLRLENECARRYHKAHPPNRFHKDAPLKADPNRRHWVANNHFFNTSLYYDSPNVHHYKYLLHTLTQHRTNLPDVEFVLQLRDYPVLHATHDARTDQTTVQPPFPDLRTTESNAPLTFAGGMAPILSHTGKDGYHDIPLPTKDDIELLAQRFFLDQCSKQYVLPQTSRKSSKSRKSRKSQKGRATASKRRPSSSAPSLVEWQHKPIAKAVFRGSGTGTGTTADTNLRLRVLALAQKHAHLFDVRLTSLNDKPKVHHTTTGLHRVNVSHVQQAFGSVGKQHRLDAQQRSRYKYNLVLDGHTRADRLGNELCTGSLVILPTPDGHRLWLEPFLVPLAWGADTNWNTLTSSNVKRAGYTHVTVSDVSLLPALVQWLTEHDDIAQCIVRNAKTWLREYYTIDQTPATAFVYDYMEGVVRAIALSSACSAARPYTLVPAKHVVAKSAPVVGIVVGFRDTHVIKTRTQQLHAFCAFFDKLFPPSWHRVVVVVEQAEVDGERDAFNTWWDTTVQQPQTTLHRYLHVLQAGLSNQTLPECVRRNLRLVDDNIHLAAGCSARNTHKHHTTTWTRDEAYRRTGEQKFNLGAVKNAGYAWLRKTFAGKRLSHVVFTDIDMLPDHELAPHYLQRPADNELIALAHRGTVYDRFRVNDMPAHVLSVSVLRERPKSHKSHKKLHNKRHNAHKRHTRGGKRRRYKPHHNKPHHHNHLTHRRRSTSTPQLDELAKRYASEWLGNKFKRFVGASVSFAPALFEAINGYPNSFWGWGGEDDALLKRLDQQTTFKDVRYTVPPRGRLMDLEMAQPVTFSNKLAARVKENFKREKLQRVTVTGDGVKELAQVVQHTDVTERTAVRVWLRVQLATKT